MDKEKTILKIFIFILGIIIFSLYAISEHELNQKQIASNDCILKYNYSIAIDSSTGYLCLKYSDYCSLLESGKKPCKEVLK